MSLINDALKKAQKQRTGEAPSLGSMPSVGGESAHQIARRSKPAGFNTLMVRAGIAGGIVLIIAVGAFFAFRDKPASTTGGSVSAPTASANVGGTSRPDNPPSSVVRPPSSETPVAPVFTLPVAKAEPAASTPANVGGTSRPDNPPPAKQVAMTTSPSTVPKPTSTASETQPSAPAAPPPKLSAHAIEFIENIKVAGIRASATDPKVLMNDRVYRPGSVVSADLGLKLVEIGTNSLTFEDDKGGRYTRTF